MVVLAFGGIVFYFLVMDEVNREIDDVLFNQKDKINEHIITEKTLPDFNTIYDIKVKISPEKTESKNVVLKDTVFYNELKKDSITYRTLVFTKKVDNQIFRFQLLKSFFEIEDLVKGILIFILLLLVFLFVTLFTVNYFVSKYSFKPFYKILDSLEKFDITKNPTVVIADQTTFEFKQLKKSLQLVTKKSRQDFIQQKEYIENASHELQTPLAIIRNKCELLLGSELLSKEQAKDISTINDSVIRLSKINHALTLITKIDNRQFYELEQINLSKHIDKHLENFKDMFAIKNISISKQYNQHPVLNMNPSLADILISNLLSNAVKHNFEKGYIQIKITDNYLLIANSGKPLSTEPVNLFKRFYKDKTKKESLGLGLTIVKKICDLYEMEITYANSNVHHEIKIALSK